MLKYLEVKYHDVFNLLTNDTGKKKRQNKNDD